MREIKFRAWDGKSVFNVEQITFNEAIWGCDKGRGVSIVFQPHIILMQFTGLHDKNGKEIYEGDITKQFHFNDGRKDYFLFHKIVWNSEWMLWQAVSLNNKEDDSLMAHGNPMLKVYAQDDFEVIGNIYENPELLNQ